MATSWCIVVGVCGALNRKMYCYIYGTFHLYGLVDRITDCFLLVSFINGPHNCWFMPSIKEFSSILFRSGLWRPWIWSERSLLTGFWPQRTSGYLLEISWKEPFSRGTWWVNEVHESLLIIEFMTHEKLHLLCTFEANKACLRTY